MFGKHVASGDFREATPLHLLWISLVSPWQPWRGAPRTRQNRIHDFDIDNLVESTYLIQRPSIAVWNWKYALHLSCTKRNFQHIYFGQVSESWNPRVIWKSFCGNLSCWRNAAAAGHSTTRKDASPFASLQVPVPTSIQSSNIGGPLQKSGCKIILVSGCFHCKFPRTQLLAFKMRLFICRVICFFPPNYEKKYSPRSSSWKPTMDHGPWFCSPAFLVMWTVSPPIEIRLTKLTQLRVPWTTQLPQQCCHCPGYASHVIGRNGSIVVPQAFRNLLWQLLKIHFTWISWRKMFILDQGFVGIDNGW